MKKRGLIVTVTLLAFFLLGIDTPTKAAPSIFFEPGTQLMPPCAPGTCTVRILPDHASSTNKFLQASSSDGLVWSTPTQTSADLISLNPALTITGGTAAVLAGTAIDIRIASGSQSGLLSANDWNTFFSKQDALGFTPYNATNPNGYISSSSISGATDTSFGALVAGNFLRYNGATWTNAGITFSDITGNLTWSRITTTPTSLAGYGITDSLVSSFNGRSSAVSLQGTDVTSALGYTPYNAANPENYITLNSLSTVAPLVYSAGTFSLPKASSTSNGYLSSTDWSAFNNKENTLTFSGPLSRTLNAISCPTCVLTVNNLSDLTSSSTARTNLLGSGTGLQYLNGLMQFVTPSTTNIIEGANLYYTDQRARAALSGGAGIQYSSTTGAIVNVGVQSVTGTTNQIIVSTATGTPILSLPQSIHTGASPTFAGLTLSGFSGGSLIFASSSGAMAQDTTSLRWDDANNRLGIGTTTPASALHVIGKVTASGGFNGQCLTSGIFTTAITNSCNMDVAESYETFELTSAGDVVAIPANASSNSEVIVSIGKSRGTLEETILGVVSTNPGLVFRNGITYLAGANDELITATSTVVTLAGRVPVKFSAENGPVRAGEELTASTQIPGYAARAIQPGMVIGTALQSSDGTSGSSTVLIFVGTRWSLGNLRNQEDLADGPAILDQFTQYIQKALRTLGLKIKDGIATLQELTAHKVTTHELCLDELCFTKEELRQMIQQSNSPAVILTPASPPETVTASETPTENTAPLIDGE